MSNANYNFGRPSLFAPRRQSYGMRSPACSYGVGQVTAGTNIGLCSLLPTEWHNKVKDIVAKVGCNEAGMTAAAAAFAGAGDTLGPILSVIGPQLIAQCVCNGAYGPLPPAPDQGSAFGNPWVLGAVGLLAVATVALVASKKRAPSEAPAPAASPPAAPAPTASKSTSAKK